MQDITLEHLNTYNYRPCAYLCRLYWFLEGSSLVISYIYGGGLKVNFCISYVDEFLLSSVVTCLWAGESPHEA